jgi:response regulator RpfG family c-di-GMP phosphodiesterase
MLLDLGRPEFPLVLIVDDEAHILESLADELRREFHVLATDNAGEALAILQRENVALVITDQRMPNLSVAELLARAVALSPDTVRVLLTGHSDVEAVIQAINEGHVYHYLSKPWDPGRLIELALEATRYHRLAADHRRLLKDLAFVQSLRENGARRASMLESELDRLEDANRWLERSLERLRAASAVLQQIGAVLPICMECGKVKNPSAEWQDIARFLQESVIPLSHGYCPSCAVMVRERLGLDVTSTDSVQGGAEGGAEGGAAN